MRGLVFGIASVVVLSGAALAGEPDYQACFNTCYAANCQGLPAGSEAKQQCMAACDAQCGESDIVPHIYNRGGLVAIALEAGNADKMTPVPAEALEPVETR